MPGTMIFAPAELTSLPITGTTWNRVLVVANADAGTPNLGNIDSIVQSKVLVQALAYARNGSGVGRAAIIAKVKAVIGTESSTTQPLNVWRQIADWMAIIDLIDLVDADVDAWVRTLADKVVPGQTNWNTLRKCARTSGNNWGAYARPSLYAVGAWLKKRGLTTSSGQTGQSLMDEVDGYFRRWLGDTSLANTFTASGSFSASWSNTGYPGSGGVINSGVPTTPGQLPGANSEDASRGGTAPPLAASGTSYSMEAMDGALMMAILVHHQGKTDVWSRVNSALRRYGQHIGSANFSASNHIYHHEPALLNHVYGLGLTEPTNDSYGGRMVPFCTDWWASPGSQFLKTAIVGDTGGGGSTGAIVAPTVSFTATVTGHTVAVDAAATTPGSAPITSIEILYGDGSAVETITGTQRTDTHPYPTTTAAATYTIRLTAIASDGGRATATRTVTVAGSNGAPVAVFAPTGPASGTGPLTVPFSFAGTFDPENDSPISGSVTWADGTTSTVANVVTSPTVTHTYAAVDAVTPYDVVATVTAAGITSSPVVRTVTVYPAQDPATAETPFDGGITIGGRKFYIGRQLIVLAPGDPRPANTRTGAIIWRTP